MSTYETYESQEGPFETPGEYEQFEGSFETGYEMYEGEDEQFLGDILSKVGQVVGPQLPGIAKGIYGALTSEGSPLSETQEMELTAELLEVASEEELEEFLGKVFKKVAQGVGGFIRSPVGKALGGVLKGVVQKALPVVGGALGSMVAPGVGTALGSKLGSLASGLFEMELEGMSQEQAEFEVARRVVRLAATSAAHAAKAPSNAPPAKVARVALTQAARQHAPGLLRGTSAGAGGGSQHRPQRGSGQGGRPRRSGGRPYGAAAYPGGGTSSSMGGYGANGGGEPSYGDGGDYGDDGSHGGRRQSGRWIRRGHKIVLLGI
ncbi:MAG: hypothetical protein QOG94_380 [Solirubrobacteraceae bacterium]|jgi:uncharacterized protein (DUF697 family)|nr:hypothetical protein [Solirubrobacteraceae bacterium]MEA2139629.1 hypothetical protein [Solirubrobacteraceae bacterium]